jgi:hypothetical protein
MPLGGSRREHGGANLLAISDNPRPERSWDQRLPAGTPRYAPLVTDAGPGARNRKQRRRLEVRAAALVDFANEEYAVGKTH